MEPTYILSTKMEDKKPVDTVITCIDVDGPATVKTISVSEHRSPEKSNMSNGSPSKSTQWLTKPEMEIVMDTSKDREMNMFFQVLQKKPFKEKLVYVLAVGTIVLLTHSVLAAQWLLPYYFSVSAPVLLLIRTCMYWYLKWQYFLLDFCYYGNIIMYIYIWAAPEQEEMFIVVFALSNGPLLWAMVIYRNSLVFHSIDKVTSVYIHLLPALLSFIIRWYPVESSKLWYTDFVPKFTQFTSLIWLVVIPMGCFILHSLLYMTLVFVVLKPSEEYMTSYRHLTSKETTYLFKTFNILGPRWRLHMYMIFNWLFCLLAVFATLLWYNFFLAHCIFMGLLFAVTVYNGASYYMDVFSGQNTTNNE